MATVAELEIIVNRLRRNIEVSERLIVQRDRLLANPDLSEAQRRTGEIVQARNREVLANQQRELAEAEQALSQAQTPGQQPPPAATAGQVAADDAPQGPTKTAEQQVTPDGRVVTAPAVTPPTNATPTTTSENDVTTPPPPVRTTEQTQATNGYNQGIDVRAEDGTLSNLRRNPETGELYDPGGTPGGTNLTTKPGTVTNDDAANNSTGTRQAEVNGANNVNVQVTPQPNVLDRYPSYTYVASVYLLTESQYKRVITSKNRKIDGYQLLFQTGGAPNNVGGIRPNNAAASTDAEKKQDAGSGAPGVASGTTPDGGRSPFFDNDFYIDSISLENQMLGKGTGAAHMAATMKFTLSEPMGMTLFDRLYKAVENQQPKDSAGKVNYTSAAYLMVIRFYGYDENGNIMSPLLGGIENESGTSDPKAVIEKFIPFQIKGINWTVGTKATSYEWECVPVGQLQGGYSGRGTIPYDVQLAAGTIGKLLKGNAQYAATTATTDQRSQQQPAPATQATVRAVDNAIAARTAPAPATQATVRAVDNAIAAGTAPAPSKANAAPTKRTVTQGLMGALNDFQDELVKQGVYTIPDRYSIEFVDGVEAKGREIEEAKLQLPNTKIEKTSTPGGASSTQDTKNLKPETNQVDMVNRTFSITAGMSILQAIEMSIRNSEYINKQQLVIVNPDGTNQPNPNAREKNFQWFTISMSATPRSGGIDPKRNDYAYDIKYTVRPFLAKNVVSKYFPTTKFSGVHKSYPFWFTGKNTAVLKYEETLNSLYQLTVSGDSKGSQADKQREAFTSSMLDIVKYGYAPRSTQSAQGAQGKTFEPAANAAENLYSPGDLANTQVRIVGDPAWIQQGSLYKEIRAGEINVDQLRKGFEPDGSISFDSQDVLFEVVWQRPEDYDLEKGVADPYSGGYSGNQNSARIPIQSRVYTAVKVISDFKNGAFEQTIHGSIYLLPKPNKTNTANPAATSSTGDTGRNAAALPPGTSDAGAGRSSSQFAARDPRRLDIGDGGKAAIIGAQQSSVSGARQFASNGGGAAFGNQNITRQGVTAGVNTRLENAPPPAPPTTSTGSTVAPPVQTSSVPPTLPPAGEVTPGQASAALTSQRVADLRARAAGTAPKYQPNQLQSREY